MNKVVVKINGSDYTLKGEEKEEYLNQIGFTVNKLIDTMLKANKKLNIYDAAILTSCNLVDEKLKLEQTFSSVNKAQVEKANTIENLSNRIVELEKEVALFKKEKEHLINKHIKDIEEKDNEIEKSKNENLLLQSSVKEYSEDNERFSKINKELKFELQSYKYKVLDLQNKLFEFQGNKKDKKDKKIEE